VDELVLQGGKERFGHRIVPAHPGAAHRCGDIEAFQVLGELGAGVLRAAVGMKDRAGRQVAVGGGHGEGVTDQVGAHVVGHRPADDALGVAVDHGGHYVESSLSSP